MAGMECLPLVHNTATPEESKHWTVISTSVLELNWLCAAGTNVSVIVTSLWSYTEFVHYSLFHVASVLKLGCVAHP
jgi:hypothetical protein